MPNRVAGGLHQSPHHRHPSCTFLLTERAMGGSSPVMNIDPNISL